MRIYVGGCHAAGKTSLLRELRSRHPDYRCIDSSIAVLRALGLKFLDELGTFPEKVLHSTADRVILSYYRSFPNLILDGHFRLGEVDAQYLEALVLLTARVDIVIRRREHDLSSRNDRVLSVEEVMREQRDIEQKAQTFARRYGFFLREVSNNGSLAAVVRDIERLYGLNKAPRI